MTLADLLIAAAILGAVIGAVWLYFALHDPWLAGEDVESVGSHKAYEQER